MQKSQTYKTDFDEVVSTTLDCIDRWDRPHLFSFAVEMSRHLLKADVGALFLRTSKDGARGHCVVLVAGVQSNGLPMKPEDYFENPEDASYKIGCNEYEGVTGWIATSGESIRACGLKEVQSIPRHIGKWDKIVWKGRPDEFFGSMVGVALRPTDPIGVLKVERKRSADGDCRPFTKNDVTKLQKIADAVARRLSLSISEGGPGAFSLGAEREFRLSACKVEHFDCKPIGEVELNHVMTSICGSDLQYFKHQKDRRKLDTRLPMVLGHETVAVVRRAGPDTTYVTGGSIRAGDRVFVVPLQPCLSCEICKSDLGENYCRHAKFMASNAPGSLRTTYQYDAHLVLPVPLTLESHHAVFAEPIANIAQMLFQVGFIPGSDQYKLVMNPSRVHDFDYLHVRSDSFLNIFNTITSEEPIPRTLFLLRGTSGTLARRTISHQNLMTKGLGILGCDQAELSNDCFIRQISRPRVLINGSGVSSFLAAQLLNHVFGVPPSSITVTGRSDARLNQFSQVALTRINPDHFADKSSLVKHLLLGAQNPDRRHYDLIIECTGGTSAQINIDLATELLAKEGVLVLFGVTDEPISLDLSAVVAKKLFLMGTYRARLETYRSALSFIVEHQRIREALDSIIDCGTIINGQSKFHDIRDSKHLAEVFRAADNRNEALGRILIRHLSPTFMSSMEPARWVLPSSLVPTLGLPASLHRKDKSTPCASPV